jgi:DNA-binding NtrC family response regulator
MEMSNNYRVSNNYSSSMFYSGSSCNGKNNYDTSASKVFLDDRFSYNNSTISILARILVVDDEPDINLVIRKMLERQGGFVVDSFVDPDLALLSFKPGVYDLLILDIRTRNMNGIDLYNRIRKIDEKIKACFISANKYYYEKIRDRLTSLAEENSKFLQKPFQCEELLQHINELIA